MVDSATSTQEKPQTKQSVALQVRNVTKIFGGKNESGFKALDNINLSVANNKFFTLLGPSGCGKTTLLRLIAGFEQPTSGELLLFGEDFTYLAPQNRPVNTVFQHYALFPHMTVAENIAFGLHMLKKPPTEIARMTEDMLALVRMEEFKERKPNQLSGGQQQRVALARALAPHPKLLLLDEPLSALDLKLRQEMRLELKRLQEKTGITFIFVTHDQEEALTMSDHIAVMSCGQIQQIGTAHEIYEQPANRFVVDFIGTANLMEAEIQEVQGDNAMCRIAGDSILCCRFGELGGDHQTGDKVTLAIRPEKIVISAMTDANHSENRLNAIVVEEIYLGEQTIYASKLADGTIIQTRLQNSDSNSTANSGQFSVGDAVVLRFARQSLWMLAD